MVHAGEECGNHEERDVAARLDQNKREERLKCVVRRQASVEYGQGGGESNDHEPLQRQWKKPIKLCA